MSDGEYGGGDAPLARLPPHNNEAEQALLGAILANNAALARVQATLQAEHFYDGVHQRIYAAIVLLVERGEIANPVTLKAQFDRDGALAEIGGAAYLARLAAAVVTIINAHDYARTIRGCWEGRQLLVLADEIAGGVEANFAAMEPMTAVREAAEARLFALGETGERGAVGLLPLAKLLPQAVQQAEDAWRNHGTLLGVTTGIRKVDALIGGMMPDELTVLAGRPGMGKEQPLHAKVRCVGGWKTMGEMRVNDLVMTPRGATARVAGVFPQGEKEVFAVTFADGRVVECGADHLFEVHSKHWLVPRVIPCSEIARLLTRVRYRKWLHVRLCEPVHGLRRDLPIDPYVLGVLLGDGDLHDSVRFMSADAALVERVRTKVGAGLEINEYDYRHFTIRRAGWARSAARVANPMTEALRVLGLHGTGSRSKFIPLDYLEGSVEQRLEMLRGLLDTDGTVEPSGTVRYCTTSHRLAHDVQTLVWSLGGICKWSVRPRPNGEAIILTIRHPDAGSLFALERKRSRLPKEYQYQKLRLRIDSVASVGRAPCQCISIDDPAGLYLTDNFVVTHNTTAAKTAVLAAASRQGKICAVFSMEMGGVQLAQWLLAETGISASRMRRGELDQEDIGELVRMSAKLQDLGIYIDDQPRRTVGQMRAALRRLKAKVGRIDLVAVDHIGIGGGSDGAARQGQTAIVTEVSGGLKTLAKEEHVPVLALSQLSRKVEEREDKRPILADLRDSGSIEQDADNVIFLYRAEYYLSAAEPVQRSGEDTEKYANRRRAWGDALERSHGLVDYIVAKQRGGPTGTVQARFEPVYSRNSDLDNYAAYGDQEGALL